MGQSSTAVGFGPKTAATLSTVVNGERIEGELGTPEGEAVAEAFMRQALRKVDHPEDEKRARQEQVRLMKAKTPAFDCATDFFTKHFRTDYYPVPVSDVFEDNEGFGLDFIPGADVEHVAGWLMTKHEELFTVTRNFKIAYRWRAKGGRRQGKLVYGRCQKTAGLLKEFSGADFVVMLSGDHCRGSRMTFGQIEALIFHELCHIDATDEYKARIEPHDFEGFIQELKLYGAWRNDLKLVEQTFQQASLFDQGEASGDAVD